MKLLVVDWDFYFRNPMGSDDPDWHLYDWGHKEAPFFIGPVWLPRALNFIQAGKKLPGLTGEETDFWDRVEFNPGAQLFYGDSNARAVDPRVEEGVTEVLLLDAHHDSGYEDKPYTKRQLTALGKAGRWSCENWMVFYFLTGRKTEVWYPRWKHWAFQAEDESCLGLDNRQLDEGSTIGGVDRVYVCRSGAWVPPWLDPHFIEFVNRAPVALRLSLEDGSLVREWDEKEVKQMAENFRKIHEFKSLYPARPQ